MGSAAVQPSRPAAVAAPAAPPPPAAAEEGWVGPLWVPGKPQPKGSTRAFMMRGRPIVTSDNSAVKPWHRAIGMAFRAAGGPAEAPRRLARVRMIFYLERPAQHFTGKNAARGTLRADVPLFPGRKPDVDKLVRAVLDALKGLAYEDDAAVVGIDATKEWSQDHRTTPGVMVWWRYLPGPTFRKGESGG